MFARLTPRFLPKPRSRPCCPSFLQVGGSVCVADVCRGGKVQVHGFVSGFTEVLASSFKAPERHFLQNRVVQKWWALVHSMLLSSISVFHTYSP